MKKIVFILVSLVAVFFASCSNDDITITTRERVNFKINPSGVVSPFSDVEAGELESFDTKYKLRVRLLVYDANSGALVNQETQYLTNYASVVNVPMDLVLGDYTVVAISDVVKYEGGSVSLEYWTLDNENVLADTQIKDEGRIGGKYKILGIANATVSVHQGETGGKDVSLSLCPAGALICVGILNMDAVPGIKEYGVLMNRSNDFINFYNNGDYEFSLKNNNNQYNWWLQKFPAKLVDYYEYYFVFPMNNVSFYFTKVSTTDERIPVTPSWNLNIKSGDEYLFFLNLNSENGIYYEYGLVNGSNRSVECVSRKGAAIRADGFTKSNVSLKSLLK